MPRLGILCILSSIAYLASKPPGLRETVIGDALCIAFFIVPIVYLAWIILRTRDMLAEPSALHPIDRWISVRSGPLASLLILLLLCSSVVEISIAERAGREPIWLTSHLALQVVHFIMEVGFVLAIACLHCPRELNPTRPAMLWKAIAGVLVIIYGLYVVLIPVGVVASLYHVE